MPDSEDPQGRRDSASYDEEPERNAEVRHVRRGGVEIVVARYAGYCYGVERALRLTGEALEGAPSSAASRRAASTSSTRSTPPRRAH